MNYVQKEYQDDILINMLKAIDKKGVITDGEKIAIKFFIKDLLEECSFSFIDKQERNKMDKYLTKYFLRIILIIF